MASAAEQKLKLHPTSMHVIAQTLAIHKGQRIIATHVATATPRMGILELIVRFLGALFGAIGIIVGILIFLFAMNLIFE